MSAPWDGRLVDKRLYLPESWTRIKDRCEAAGVPEDRRGYRAKTELALEMVGRHIPGPTEGWHGSLRTMPSVVAVIPATAILAALGDVVRAGRRPELGWPPEPASLVEYQGFGRQAEPQSASDDRSGPMRHNRRTFSWREITVADRNPGTPQLPVQCPEGAGTTDEIHCQASGRQRTPPICPMHRKIPRWRPWHTWEDPPNSY